MRVLLDVTIITSPDVVNYWRALGQLWSFVAGKDKGKICITIFCWFIHTVVNGGQQPHMAYHQQ